MPDPALSVTVTSLWFSMALLSAGYARTRNRSAWNWFFSTLVLGPIAVFLLVVWPPVELREKVRVQASTGGDAPTADIDRG